MAQASSAITQRHASRNAEAAIAQKQLTHARHSPSHAAVSLTRRIERIRLPLRCNALCIAGPLAFARSTAPPTPTPSVATEQRCAAPNAALCSNRFGEEREEFLRGQGRSAEPQCDAGERVQLVVDADARGPPSTNYIGHRWAISLLRSWTHINPTKSVVEAHTTSFNAVTQHVLIQDVDEPEAIADVRGTCPVCHVRAARAHPRSIDPNRVMIIRINHGKALTTMTEVGMAQTLQTEYGWHRVDAAACHPGNTPHAGITSHCSRVGMVTGRSPTQRR